VTRVYFSIGSNVEPSKHIRLAVAELERRFSQIDVSPVYRNKAVGFVGDDFLNLVVGVDSDKSINELCQEIDAIHILAKRKPNCGKLVSRTLDIDLLLYGQLVTDGPPLSLPRSDVLKYSFALGPLADIAPNERHPETGKTFATHWAEMNPLEHPLQRVDT
jgi:2-amino-4-hydroxy-6-hydroxymethyldihydropteridine diphosphokinase